MWLPPLDSCFLFIILSKDVSFLETKKEGVKWKLEGDYMKTRDDFIVVELIKHGE